MVTMVTMATMAAMRSRLWLGLCVLLAVSSRTMAQTCSQHATTECQSNADKGHTWSSPLLNITATPPDGIGFLGRGFDLYRGNLLSSDGAIGFRLPVVKLDYEMNKRTPDNAYLIPDKTDLLQMIQTSPNGSSHIVEVRAPPDFLRMMAQRIKVRGQPSLADGRFQASRAYQELLAVPGDKTVLYDIEEKRFYRASLEGNAQKATKSFVESFNQLPQECTAGTRPHYLDFLAAYGTHVASQVILGQLLIRKKSFTTEELLNFKAKGETIQGDLQWKDLEKKAVPVEVRLEPLQNFITSSFLGSSSVSDIGPRRDCLIQSITQYCQSTTNQPCLEDDSPAALRYGDEIRLFNSADQELMFQKELAYISGGHVGFPLSFSSANTHEQMSLLIIPTYGQSGRLGDPLMYGDVFGLASTKNSNPEQRVVVSKSRPIPYIFTETQDSMTESMPTFYDTASSQRGFVMCEPSHELKYIEISFETSRSEGLVVSQAGPWLLTLGTREMIRTFLVDPCVNFCLPGSVLKASVSMPSDSVDIQKVTMKPLPQWSDDRTRLGTWAVQSLKLMDGKTFQRYNIGPFTISAEPSSCPICTLGEWTLQNGLTQTSIFLMAATYPTIPAEYHFIRKNTLSHPSILVSNNSNVILYTRGLYLPEKKITSCSEMYCQHNGQCIEKPGERAHCRCTGDWTGLMCDSPCMSEILTLGSSNRHSPQVYGSSGQFSNNTWIFASSSQANNYIVVPLLDQYRVIAFETGASLDINRITVEIFNVETQKWSEPNVKRLSGGSDRYSLSSKNNDEFLLLEKIKLNFRGTTMSLDGFKIYGCIQRSHRRDLVSIFTSQTLTLSFKPAGGGAGRNKQDGVSKQGGSAQPLIIAENISFVLHMNQSVQCETESDSVRWAVARQLKLCPSMISINKIQTETDLNNLKTILVEVTLSGEEDSVLPAKNLADALISSGELSLDCTAAGFDVKEVRDIVSAAESRLFIVMAVLLFLVLICLVLFIIFLVRLSYKYRDIHNELTTLRKLKMQKRIAKRQELHPQPHVPYHSFTLPRPNSAGSSSATTSIPGRNGQTRPLRYSQSLHGQNDRIRASNLQPHTGRGPIDPSNYIISNPSPVVRTPSPGGTKSGEDSDTVQSMC